MTRSSNVRFARLTVRHGGENTARLHRVQRITFDHVRILASSHGVRMGRATRVVFRHCVFSGGLPTWYFRSDRKAAYSRRDGDRVISNSLGAQTQKALITGSRRDHRTTIHHSEFVNGHDVILDGDRLKLAERQAEGDQPER